jgi:hypothetical protein
MRLPAWSAGSFLPGRRQTVPTGTSGTWPPKAGLAGLVPRKRGPHGAHKLDDAVMAFVATLRAEDPALSVRALLPGIHARFGFDVHPAGSQVRKSGR